MSSTKEYQGLKLEPRGSDDPWETQPKSIQGHVPMDSALVGRRVADLATHYSITLEVPNTDSAAVLIAGQPIYAQGTAGNVTKFFRDLYGREL